MEREDNYGTNSKPSLLGGIFAITDTGNGQNDSAAQAQAVRQLHARLASSEFVNQMTGIFFDAKRAALTSSK
ncbi:MAG: hypothetical protein HY301_10945 [Verrucomicrobia bacterium]|nr:hypothetical protein [Verrucomicrobiota bacterium]